jgi:hypothetical protein
MSQTTTYTDDLTGDTATSDDGLPSGWYAVHVQVTINSDQRSGAALSSADLTWHTSSLNNVHDLVIAKGTEYLASLDQAIIDAGGTP